MTPRALTSHVKKIRRQLPYVPQAVGLVWEAAGGWTAAWAVLLILQGILPTATVLLTRTLVDSLVATLAADADVAMLKQTIGVAVLMAAVLLLAEVLRSAGAWVRTAQAERVQDHIHRLLHDQAQRLDMIFYDRAEYYDQLHRARVDALSRPMALLENIGRVVQNGITLVALACVLVSYAWWLPLVLVIGALPALWVAGKHTLRFYRWQFRNTANIRRTRYFDHMLTWSESAAEIRLFDLGTHFKNAFQALRRQLRTERVNLATRQMWAEIGAGVIALAFMGATMLWMLWRAFNKAARLGDLALFYQVFNQGLSGMRTLVGSVKEVYRNMLFLENLFQFLALTPTVQSPETPEPVPRPLNREIRLAHVTFRYPDMERAALDDFSLSVPAGKMTAIVGENGAGKSTLIKLLCRYYDPQAGRITLDGIDIRKFDLAELRRHVAVLFQQPVHFHDTAADNIAFGDLAAAPRREDILAAAKSAGAHHPIQRLAEGYETILGKWFGGAELSVGEWQRLALARAYIRKAPLIILDEPTSAMDSWAEADWMARFRELAAGCTVLIITHRFTTALRADMIHVMMGGHIVESGTHAELIAADGLYAVSWARQTQDTCEADAGLAAGRPPSRLDL